MTLGEKIKACRQNAGMSQEKVAALMGVSRQAVTKWEADQSAPHTEHLFRLAEIFGTTVDFLLAPAEQSYHKREEEKRAEARRSRRRRNLRLGLAVAGGYMAVYLAGRIFGTTGMPTSAMGWLLGDDPGQLSYLYGWLLRRKLFWAAMAISVVPACFGKKYAAVTSLLGFVLALLLGELCGYHPAGAAYGHGHYGWLIWGGIFSLSVVLGVVLEKVSPGKRALSPPA